MRINTDHNSTKNTGYAFWMFAESTQSRMDEWFQFAGTRKDAFRAVKKFAHSNGWTSIVLLP